MKQNLLLLIVFICCSFYFAACTSESYNIDNANSSDTAVVKTPVIVNTAEVEKILKSKRTYTVKSAPTFVLSFNGQINIGVSEMSLLDNPSQFIEGQNFGVRNGWGINALGKIPIDKEKGNLRVIIQGSYNHFQGNFNNTADAIGDIRYNIMSGGVGIENNFTPKFSVKPFVGAALMGSLISGSSSYDTGSAHYDIKITNSFRLGYSLYAGIEYGVSDRIGIQLGAKFTSCNTWLKSSKFNGSNTEFSLRDAFTSLLIPYGGWKNFAFTSFYIGTSIYFGVKDKIFRF